MNFYNIYERMPVVVQNWLVGLYSLKLEHERGGKEFDKILSFLLSTSNWSAEQIRRYKEENIARVLKHAYEHCPYYRIKYDAVGRKPDDFHKLEDLEKFPILTKDEIREHTEEMIADNVNRKRLLHYHTSGTTGKALDFYLAKDTPKWYWAICARYGLRFDVKPHSRCLNFVGKVVVPINQNKPPYWRYKKAQNQYMLPMQHITREKVPSIVEFINKDHFQIITGYPSIIYSFCQFVNELGLMIERIPKFYFTGAEKVYDYQADEINKAFPGLTIVEHYSFSEEVGAASMCKQMHYHEDFELGHMELKDPVENGSLKTGTLLITGFHNDAMPLIRYEVGDTLTFDNIDCECGLKSQVIHEINGRNEDFVITPEGTRIMRFDYLFKDTRDIKECQVVQRKLGEIILRIVRREYYNQKETEAHLREEVKTWISPTIEVKFEYVEEIERTKAGKFKAVVSELSK